MDSLQNIMGNRQFKAPDDVTALKDYIWRNYKSGSRIRTEKGALILSVPSSALASMLQLDKQKLIKDCGISKRLVIRVGS